MNKLVLKRWIRALRSGKYTKRTGKLTDDCGTSFCALGVLCDLADRSNIAQRNGTGYEGLAGTNGKSSSSLPAVVKEWSGLETVDPYIFINGNRDSVAGHNDAGRTFVEIANGLERECGL